VVLPVHVRPERQPGQHQPVDGPVCEKSPAYTRPFGTVIQ
jgi:hypothetical protein